MAAGSLTSGAAVNNAIQPCGQTIAARPINPVASTAMPAAIQVMRTARASWPAPTLVPTIATKVAPSPNTTGYMRYSRRTAAPTPASAAAPSEPA